MTPVPVPAALPPVLADEASRQDVLNSYCVLDTPPEARFDNITRLAAHFFHAPIAAVSLVDCDRQWFKSLVGLTVSETPRDIAFCAHTIADDAVMVVLDATQDPRFAGNPLVTGAPHIRFYAGAPLIANGCRLGTLCVIDDTPRAAFDARAAETLAQLAKLVVDELDLRREIARRERAEADLRERSRLLTLAQEVGGFGHWHTDFRSGERRWSDEVFRILGFAPGSLMPTAETTMNMYHPDDRPMMSALLERVMSSGEGFAVEARVVRPDGTLRHVFARGVPEIGPDGKLVGLVGVLQDITDRKREEAELRLAKQTLSDAIEAIPDGFVFYDADDRLILCNQRYRDAHPRTAPFIVPGTSFEAILRAAVANGEFGHPPSGAAADEAWIQAELEGHRNPGQPFERQLADGRWIVVTENRTASGALVGTRTDITDRKRFEAELQRQAADMCALAEGLDTAREDADLQRFHAEAATRAKSDFLAAMSHEIRTPMNGIMGMTELLFDTPLTEEQRQFAQAVRSSANALLTIINDILDISKLEAGKVTIEALPFDPADLVEGVVELLTPRAREKDIEVGFFIDPQLRRTLIGDPTRIRQILVNLVGNAVKFTESGTVAVELEALDATDGHLVLRMAVTDSGIGIPEDALPTLFNKFQQVDGSITRKYGGTGLGLAICRQLSELMGGGIAVESALGRGSRFQVEIPLILGAAEVAPVARPMAGRRALVADDLAISRRVLSSMLESLGAQVVTVDSALDALDALKTAASAGQPFDVALIDQTMPVISGESLLAAMAGLPELAGIKRVLVTSMGSGAGSGIGAGAWIGGDLADATLSKPLRQAALADCLIGLFDPAARHAKPAASPAPPPEASAPRAGRILLAEDNRTNQLFAATLLHRLGYSVAIAGDGEQALAVAAAGGIDLILMDVQMPGMDGLDAATAIRALGGPRAAVPIIALTADAMPGTREQCLDAGMNDYITKPIARPALLAALDHWLDPARPVEAVSAETKARTRAVAETMDPPENAEAALDESVLVELEASVGDDNLSLIVGHFLEDMAERLGRLAGVGETGTMGETDLRLLAGEAHDLSSMAGSFGGMGVMHLAWRLEVCCRHGERAQANALLPALLREAGRLERALHRRLEERDRERRRRPKGHPVPGWVDPSVRSARSRNSLDDKPAGVAS